MLFPLPTKANFDDDFAMPVRIVRFGDGYSERQPDGLNRPRESWNVEVFYATEIADEALQDFLIEHGQWKPFQWQSPRDKINAQNYVITGGVSTATRRGGEYGQFFYTRRLKFERYWDYVIPLLGLRLNSILGWTVTRTGGTDTALTVNYSILVTPSAGSPYTVTGTATIGVGQVSVNISTVEVTAGSETLTILSGSYELPTPASLTQISGQNYSYIATNAGDPIVTNLGEQILIQ